MHSEISKLFGMERTKVLYEINDDEKLRISEIYENGNLWNSRVFFFFFFIESNNVLFVCVEA